MTNRREMQLVLIVVFLAMGSGSLGQSTTPAPAPPPVDCSSLVSFLLPCESYVQGQAKSPGQGCCQGLTTVVQRDAMCLCQLINYAISGAASGLGLNKTIALQLPQTCGIKTVNVNECPGLQALLGPTPATSQGGEATPSKGTPSGSQNSAHLSTPTIGVYLGLLGIILML